MVIVCLFIRKFFHWLYNQLGYKSLGDWYMVSQEDIVKWGGGSLLYKYYDNSPTKAVLAIYPTHNWNLEKFGREKKV